jgi:Ser/Thr protein kinase RdoA (MazF antagonist)
MPRRNGISEKEISDYWGIELAEPFEVIPALTNAVVRCGAYVIRSERRPIESVAWEHDLLSFLSAGVPEVVAPIHAKDGGTFLAQRGDVVSVFPYVHAEHMKRNDEEVHVQLPLNLGRIHRRATAWPKTRQRPGQPSFRELDFEKNLWWDRSIIPRTPVLEDAFD